MYVGKRLEMPLFYCYGTAESQNTRKIEGRSGRIKIYDYAGLLRGHYRYGITAVAMRGVRYVEVSSRRTVKFIICDGSQLGRVSSTL